MCIIDPLLISQTMESTVAVLNARYPVLLHFNLADSIDHQLLATLAPEVHLPIYSMTSECKKIMKQVRAYVTACEQKLKKGRRLYKILGQFGGHETELIANNSKLDSLQALQGRNMPDLVDLQLNSNRIDSLTPLVGLNAPELQQIDLTTNCVVSLRPLMETNWPRLKKLHLAQNNIESIQGVGFARFSGLTYLNLCDNLITSIRPLRKELGSGLKHLTHLGLVSNYILDWGMLPECCLDAIKEMGLHGNIGSAMGHIERADIRSKLAFKGQYHISLNSQPKGDHNQNANYRARSGHNSRLWFMTYENRVKRDTIQKQRRLVLQ